MQSAKMAITNNILRIRRKHLKRCAFFFLFTKLDEKQKKSFKFPIYNNFENLFYVTANIFNYSLVHFLAKLTWTYNSKCWYLKLTTKHYCNSQMKFLSMILSDGYIVIGCIARAYITNLLLYNKRIVQKATQLI